MSDTRADTTSMGLFLISFILLVFGLVGILMWNESPHAGLAGAAAPMMSLVGVLLAFCGYSAWRGGNKFLMIVFGFIAFFCLSYSSLSALGGAVWLYWIVVAIFFVIFAVWTLLAKGGYMLTLLLIMSALVFLFNGIIGNTTGDAGTYWLLLGIFAIIGFLISVYMALADVTERNLPVF